MSILIRRRYVGMTIAGEEYRSSGRLPPVMSGNNFVLRRSIKDGKPTIDRGTLPKP